jgi:hypothetical protein
MEFSLRAILGKSGLHSTYMFSNNFAPTLCKSDGREMVVGPDPDASEVLVRGDIESIKKIGYAPYLYSPVRESKIYKPPKRSKAFIDPVSTSYQSIHTSLILEKSVISDNLEFASSDLVLQGEIMWKQRYPLETRSFRQYLIEFETRLSRTSKHVDPNISIMRHVRYQKKGAGCGGGTGGKHVIDYTWINLASGDREEEDNVK